MFYRSFGGFLPILDCFGPMGLNLEGFRGGSPLSLLLLLCCLFVGLLGFVEVWGFDYLFWGPFGRFGVISDYSEA